MSWMRAVKYVHDNHSFRLIHVPTGNLVTQKKTSYYLELFEMCEEVNETGYLTPDSKKACQKISRSDCVMCDAVTANMLMTVYNALEKSENKEKFANMNILKAVEIGWKLVK